MSLKDGLDSSLRKDGKKRRGNLLHRKAYHRFFEGYSEIAVPNANGRGYKIQRIYTGDTYRQDLTQSQRILLRLLYVTLFLGAAYLFVSSGIQPRASNATWYVSLPQAASIPFLFWIVIVFITYLPAKQELTIYEYRSSSLALQRATLGAAISLGLIAFAMLIFVLVSRPDEPAIELLSAVKYLAGGLFALAMNQVEKRVNYRTIPGQNTPPPGEMETNGANQP